MELITQTVSRGEDETTIQLQSVVYEKNRASLRRPLGAEWDEIVLAALHRRSIPTLRVALGLVFIWFGALKVFGVSPIIPILRETYTFLPLPVLGFSLGIWEILIGSGLLCKRALRATLGLLCLHMSGTFMALWFAPAVFFNGGNPLVLTASGEFVAKNIVLLTAGLVIAGYEVTPRARKRVAQLPTNGKISGLVTTDGGLPSGQNSPDRSC
jgi:putative oxidoreductase